MNNITSYCIELTPGQLDYLAGSKYGIDRMKILHCLISAVVLKETIYSIKGFTTTLQAGQAIMSEVDLSNRLHYDKKCQCRTNPLRLSVRISLLAPFPSVTAVTPFASSHRAFLFIEQHIPFMKMTNTKNKNQAKETSRRTLRLEARVTKEEYAKAAELAQTCGLSMSDYIRRVATGHKPRRRLTEREIEALNSLSDARGDIRRIVSAVRNIQADRRALYFGNPQFVEKWMGAALPLMKRWEQIQDYITE